MTAVKGLWAVAAASLAMAGWATAPSARGQAPKTPPARQAVPAEPGTTTASYGDWVMRCQAVGTPEKPGRACEVAQWMQVQGQSAPIAQFALARAANGLVAVAVLPTNVAFPSQVRILRSDKDTPGQALNWRRCVPGGCVAEGIVDDAVVGQWRAATQGRIVFTEAAGRQIAIPLSYKGLAQALDALDQQPRAARPGR